MADEQAGDLTFAASSTLPAAADASSNLTAQLSQMHGMMTGQESPLTFGPRPTTPTLPPQFKSPEGAFNIPQGPFGTVGERKRADKQALFGGIAKMVKAGTEHIQAKKTRALQMDIERLMSAYEGMKEAESSGDKDAYIKNAAIVNDLTSDPKKSKLIAKAFNIDLLGGGKNKNENKALYGAYQEYDKKQKGGQTPLNPNAQRILGGMPQRQQIDPKLQAQAELIKAKILPEANKVMEEAGKDARSLQTATTAKDKMASIEKLTKGLIDAKKYGVDRQFDEQLKKNTTAEDVARIHASAAVQVENTKAKTILEALDKRDAELTQLANINNDSKESIANNKNLTAKEIANQKAGLALQKNALNEIGKRYRDLKGKLQENLTVINNGEKQLKDSPSLFSAINPLGKGTDVKTWYKNRQTLSKLSQDIQEAQKQNQFINRQMSELDKQRQKVMEQLAIQPLPADTGSSNTNTGSDEKPIDTSSNDKGSGGDINIQFDMREAPSEDASSN